MNHLAMPHAHAHPHPHPHAHTHSQPQRRKRTATQRAVEEQRSAEGTRASAALSQQVYAAGGAPLNGITPRTNKRTGALIRIACMPCHKARTSCDRDRLTEEAGDGSRPPCSRCVRLDRAHLCVDRPPRRSTRVACINCIGAKRSCQDERPCRRCVHLGLSDTCYDRDDHPVVSRAPAPGRAPAIAAPGGALVSDIPRGESSRKSRTSRKVLSSNTRVRAAAKTGICLPGPARVPPTPLPAALGPLPLMSFASATAMPVAYVRHQEGDLDVKMGDAAFGSSAGDSAPLFFPFTTVAHLPVGKELPEEDKMPLLPPLLVARESASGGAERPTKFRRVEDEVEVPLFPLAEDHPAFSSAILFEDGMQVDNDPSDLFGLRPASCAILEMSDAAPAVDCGFGYLEAGHDHTGSQRSTPFPWADGSVSSDGSEYAGTGHALAVTPTGSSDDSDSSVFYELGMGIAPDVHGASSRSELMDSVPSLSDYVPLPHASTSRPAPMPWNA